MCIFQDDWKENEWNRYFRHTSRSWSHVNGTGISDIFLEAGLMSSGSLTGVLSGTNYSRAMNCHKHDGKSREVATGAISGIKG